jgi:membrane fusion protein (multidrug efflux system)
MFRHYIPITAGLLTAVFTAGLLLFPQLREEGGKPSGLAQARPPADQPIPVVIAIATIEPFTESVEALGTAKANESVVITPTVEERITGIFFEDGQSVVKHQVLVKLDDSEAQFLLAEAKATLYEQQQQFERMRRLAKTNATSRSQLDEEKGLLEIAKAKVAYLEAQKQDYTIRAPFSGILGIRQVSVGAVVDSDTVISTRVDPETRTLTICAQIPNPDRLLKPGMLLSVDLVKDPSQTLIIIDSVSRDGISTVTVEFYLDRDLEAEDNRSVLRGNRIPMVGLGIVRQSKANTLDVAHTVQQEAKRTNEVNSVRGIVVLSRWSQRDRSMQEIMAQVNRQLATLPGYRAFSVARRGLGGGTGKPIAFVSTPVWRSLT